MEKSTTSKIIVGAFIGLLAICLTWAIISQQSKVSFRERLGEEQSTSKALVAENVLLEKALSESKDSNNLFIKQRAELDEALEHRSKMLTTQTLENKRIAKALRFAEQQRETHAKLNYEFKAKLDSQLVSYSTLDSLTRSLLDSINVLKTETAYLENELNDAVMRKIDQTVVSAVKRKDSKFTSKARAARKLIAAASPAQKKMAPAVAGARSNRSSNQSANRDCTKKVDFLLYVSCLSPFSFSSSICMCVIP